MAELASRARLTRIDGASLTFTQVPKPTARKAWVYCVAHSVGNSWKLKFVLSQKNQGNILRITVELWARLFCLVGISFWSDNTTLNRSCTSRRLTLRPALVIHCSKAS